MVEVKARFLVVERQERGLLAGRIIEGELRQGDRCLPGGHIKEIRMYGKSVPYPLQVGLTCGLFLADPAGIGPEDVIVVMR